MNREEERPAPSPPTAGDDADRRAGGLLRALAVAAALLIGVAAGIVIAVMLDLGSSPICDDVGGALTPTEDCYDITSGEKPVVLGLGWIGGVLGAVAALAFLRFTFKGRGGKLALMLAGAAIVFAGASLALG